MDRLHGWSSCFDKLSMRMGPFWASPSKMNLILSLSKDEAISVAADITDQIRQTVRDQGFLHKLTAGESLPRQRPGVVSEANRVRVLAAMDGATLTLVVSA